MTKMRCDRDESAFMLVARTMRFSIAAKMIPPISAMLRTSIFVWPSTYTPSLPSRILRLSLPLRFSWMSEPDPALSSIFMRSAFDAPDEKNDAPALDREVVRLGGFLLPPIACSALCPGLMKVRRSRTFSQ